jgi:uncharacterized protein with von Willebrand factor type A (vWA) domain
LAVGTGQLVAFSQGVAALDPSDSGDVYWAARACLVSRHEDTAAFDRAFRRWAGHAGGIGMKVTGELPRLPAVAPRDDLGSIRRRLETTTEADRGHVASSADVLRTKRFADCTPDELATLAALMAQLRLRLPDRRVRRTAPAANGRYPDLRRTVRRAMRSHGELLDQSWRARRVKPRRVVLLLDVSGSMAGYSRALLQFAHTAARHAAVPTEVFCFGTRLTRVTVALRHRQPDQALARAAETVVDWEGGTRIGDSVRTFVREWGRRGLARGAVVVICSDGLERGDPAALAAEMEKLARLAHRIVWVNPLKGDPRYQPLAGGMAAALPHVDVFLSGHDLASLEALAALLPDMV